MKSSDQQLLEEAYLNVLNNNTSTIPLDEDEDGWFKPHRSAQGKVLKNRFFSRFDSKGSYLSDLKEPSLEEGQFLVNTTPYVVVYKVEKTEEGFQGVQTKQYPEGIEEYLKQRSEKIKDNKGLEHFFPKNL
jgi:hypothetical protein